MKIEMFPALLALPFLVLTSSAFAGQKEASACAASLKPEAQLIYAAAAPSIAPDKVIKDLLPSIIRPMVESGKVARSTARDSGAAAGACLKLLQ